MAAWEKAGSGSIGSYGLLRFILGRVAVTECDPAGCECLIHLRGLLEVFAGVGILLDEVVVGADCVP